MEFRPDAFLIGLVLFSFIIAVGSGFITDMAEHYEVDYDSKFGATYTQIQEVQNLSTDQKESVIGGELPDEDLLDSSIRGATSALNLMTAPVETVTLIAGSVQSEIKPALDITIYVKTILTILVIFSLIYLAFRIRSW